MAELLKVYAHPLKSHGVTVYSGYVVMTPTRCAGSRVCCAGCTSASFPGLFQLPGVQTSVSSADCPCAGPRQGKQGVGPRQGKQGVSSSMEKKSRSSPHANRQVLYRLYLVYAPVTSSRQTRAISEQSSSISTTCRYVQTIR